MLCYIQICCTLSHCEIWAILWDPHLRFSGKGSSKSQLTHFSNGNLIWEVPPEHQVGREVGIATFRIHSQKERTGRQGTADSSGRAAMMVWTEERRRTSQRESQNWRSTEWGNSGAVSPIGGSLSRHSFSDFVWFCSNQESCLTLLHCNSSAAVCITCYLGIWETIWKISSNSLHEFWWRHLVCALCSLNM